MKKLALFFIPLMSISLLVNCGNKAKTFHIIFTSGEEIVDEKDYKENEVIVAPEDPAPYEKDHKTYTFDAWYDGDTKFESGVTKATKDVEYVAKFNGVDIKYTVTFMNDEEEYKKITDAKYGDEIIAPETNPTKDTDKKYEYTFNKWIYKDTGKDFVTGDKVEGNTIIVADYTKDPITYTATFKKSGENDVKVEFNADNLSVKAPTFTAKDHYTCIWSASGEHESSGKKAGSGETITFTEDELDNWEFTYIESVISYSIKFEKDGEVVETITKKITDENLNFTAPEFTSTTHYDGKWYCKDLGEGGTSLGSGTECTALNSDNLDNYTFVYQEEAHPYKVTFNYADGQTESVKKYISAKSLIITAPKTQETPQVGYRYVWKTSDGLIIESEASKTFTESELNVYDFCETEVENIYTITYVLGDYSAINPDDNPTSYKVTDNIALTAPTLEGFTFKGWYLSDNEHNKFQYQNGWTAGQMTGNLTLYADWHIADKTLNDYYWQEISDISDNDEASKYFDISDTKTVNVNSVDHQVRINDYNYDKLSTPSNDEPQYAGITFEFVNTISGVTSPWDSSGLGHNYDFINSTLNTRLQPGGTIYKMMPSELTDVIKMVNKKVRIHPEAAWIDGNYNTQLFPLSYDEIYGNNNGRYEYYKVDTRNRCNKYVDYWLRSPFDEGPQYNTQAGLIRAGGGHSADPLDYEHAVAPAFCI